MTYLEAIDFLIFNLLLSSKKSVAVQCEGKTQHLFPPFLILFSLFLTLCSKHKSKLCMQCNSGQYKVRLCLALHKFLKSQFYGGIFALLTWMAMAEEQQKLRN